MSTKRRLQKANSLHVQMIFALLLACIIPLVVVTVFFLNSYKEHTKQELQEKVQELCADFANRIQITGYLTNTAQAEISAAMDTAAQIYDGRILVVNSELQIVKDTFNREEGRTMISEEVVQSLQGKNLSYHFFMRIQRKSYTKSGMLREKQSLAVWFLFMKIRNSWIWRMISAGIPC